MQALSPVPLWRLYGLRASYLLLAVGLGLTVWPGILHHDHPWGLSQGVVNCLLGAIGLLALLGLRHPLAMLPLLLFEITWKAIWLAAVGLPLWLGRGMDAQTWSTASAVLMVAIFPPLIPWRYVAARFVAAPADRWR